ncbi:MAG: hypothetical protein QM760_19315 [Nibricoccus sp.]
MVGTDQMFTLESLSTMRVEEAVRTGGKEKTDLVMKYGAASYGIEAAGREYDSVIRTPGSHDGRPRDRRPGLSTAPGSPRRPRATPGGPCSGRPRA